MSNVMLYIIGTLLIAGGAAYGTSLYFGTTWAIVVALLIAGFGVIGSINGRRRESSPAD